LGQGPGHRFGGSTWFDPSQCTDKIIKVVIIKILKPELGVHSGQGPGHGLRGSTWVDQKFILKNNNQSNIILV